MFCVRELHVFGRTMMRLHAEVCVLGERAGQDDHGMTGGERQLNIVAGRGLSS